MVAAGVVEPVCLLHGSVSADVTIVFTRLSCSYSEIIGVGVR